MCVGHINKKKLDKFPKNKKIKNKIYLKVLTHHLKIKSFGFQVTKMFFVL